MKFIINETGKHEELSIIDTKTGSVNTSSMTTQQIDAIGEELGE